MIVKIADSIISPLGMTVGDNFEALLNGESRLELHEDTAGLLEPFCASMLDRDAVKRAAEAELHEADKYTFFEQLCLLSAQRAVSEAGLDAGAADVLFVLSTTKGNVDCLEEDVTDERAYLATSAEKIAEYFGNSNCPVVVSNACISGVCAQISGVRALLTGRYKYAVIIGCDILSRFIISGFQSFKALSQEPCKPFDKERVGLNLGEAAATMILEARTNEAASADEWVYAGSSIHNDANHISGPSRTGEGSYRVLCDLLKCTDATEVGFVNVHGTSTPYNDEMESIALDRAGLSEVPVNGLKGVYGHTLGAAGLLETILSMRAIDRGVVLPTKGFSELGVSRQVSVSNITRSTDKKCFFKILSGFGGSNAGIAYKKGGMA